MTRLAPFVILVASGLLASGCVSQKKYDALQRDLDDSIASLQGKIDERDAQMSTLQEALASEEARRAACDQEVMDLGARIQPLEDQLSDMRDLRDAAEAELAEALASKKNMKASIEEMKRALADARTRRVEAERRIARYRQMLRKFKPLIDAGKLEVMVSDGRMVLVLPTDVLFESGRARLSEDGASAIGEVGAALADMKERRFQVEGHTDSVPISTTKYPSNWELASARALGVVRALLDAGVAAQNLSAASHGEFRPAQSNDSDAGKARNRRIEIVIVPDLSGLPGFDELNELAKPVIVAPKR